MEKNDVRTSARAIGEQMKLFADIYQESERQTEAAADPLSFADDYGIYRPIFDKSLKDRATAYHNNNRAAVERLLNEAGFTDQEAARILTDYHAAAYGLTLYTATPETMAKALRELSPRKCYLTDKYLFYDMIFRGYADRLFELRRYLETLAATDNDKIAYLYPLPPIPSADAVSWGIIYDFINVSAFYDLANSEGWVLHNEETTRLFGFSQDFEVFKYDFIDITREAGDAFRYYHFFYFAEKALLATTLELSTITRPDVLEHQIPGELYREYGADLLKSFAEWDEREAKSLEEKDTRPIVNVISKPLANIGAGGLTGFQHKDAATPGKNMLQLLRLTKDRGGIAPKDFAMCERVINGINIMYGESKFKDGPAYQLAYLSYNEFYRGCGYVPDKMSMENKRQLTAAAFLLHNIQFLKDGEKYLPILFVEKEIDGVAKLEIQIPNEYVNKENRLLATQRQMKALRSAKVGAHTRFHNMILTRGHKMEDDILTMIYNYDAELDEAMATGGVAAVKKMRNSWSKNKSKKRALLEQWFEEAKQNGVIKSYKKTGKNGPVYEWKK